MTRRAALALLCGVVLGSIAVGLTGIAFAQEATRVRHIALLMAYKKADRQTQQRVSVFRQSLHELGWVDGQNARIVVRWLEGKTERTDAAPKIVRPDVESRQFIEKFN